jgi:hypothetical protein
MDAFARRGSVAHDISYGNNHVDACLVEES